MADKENILRLGAEDNLSKVAEKASNIALKHLGEKITALTKITNTFNKEGKPTRYIIEGITTSSRKAVVVVDEFGKTIRKARGIAPVLKETTVNLTKLDARFEKLNRTIAKHKQEVTDLKLKNSQLNQSYRNLHSHFNRSEREVMKLTKQTDRLKKQNDNLIKTNERLAQTTKYSMDAYGQFVNVIRSIERVAAFFMLRRALFGIVNGVQTAVQSLGELHGVIQQIQTISQTSASSTGAWADSLLRVSNAWNLDLVDTANAAYQTLSNQVTNTREETERFLFTIAEFSKVTGASAEAGVNLITSALNSFNISTTEADHVAAIFFKTIELGRIKASELSESFGRVAVVANQIGVSLEETAAMLDIITIKGVKAGEAQTLLRGVFMKLAKPTEEMKDLFDKLGVSSAEQLIQIYGLADTFKILYEETKGTNTALAELFGRIRPTMGMSALIQQFEKFPEVLNEIKYTSEEAFDVAKQYQFQTVGEEYQKNMNQIKNIFTTDIANDYLTILMNITRGFDTVKTSASGVKTEINGLANITEKLTKWFIGTTVIASTLKGYSMLTASWGKHLEANIAKLRAADAANITGPIQGPEAYKAQASKNVLGSMLKTGLYGVGLAVAGALTSALATYITNIMRAREETYKFGSELLRLDALKNITKDFDMAFEDFNEATREANQGIAGFSGKWRLAIDAAQYATEELEEKVKSLKEELKDVYSGVADSIKDVFGNLTNDLKELKDVLKDIAEMDTQQGASTEDAKLRAKLLLNKGDDKVALLEGEIERIRQTLFDITDVGELGNKVDSVKNMIHDQFATRVSLWEQETKAHEEYIKDLEELNAEESKLLREGKDTSEIQKERDALIEPYVRAKPSIEHHNKRLEQASYWYDTLSGKIKETIETKIDNKNNLLSNLSEARDLILNTKGLPDNIKSMFSGIDFRTEEQKQQDTQGLIDLLSKGPDAFVNSLLGGDAQKLLQDFLSANNLLDSNMAIIKSETHLAYIAKMQDHLLKAQTETKQAAEEANKNYKEEVKSVQTNASEAEKLLRNINAGKHGFARSNINQQGEREFTKGRMRTDLGTYVETSRSWTKFDGLNDFADFLTKFSELPLEEQITRFNELATLRQDLRNQTEQYKYYAESTDGKIDANEKRVLRQLKAVDDLFTDMSNSLVDANLLKTEQLEAEQLLIETTEKYNIFLDDLNPKLKTLNDEFDKAGPATATFAEEVQKLIKIMLTAPGMEDMEGMNRYMGGAVYANKGMFMPKSTDTIPAMLTPGEFVMNKSATKAFGGRLLPMNYGQQNLPSNSSSNVNVGDINVSINNKGNLSAKEIAYAIKNEVRRGILR